MIVFGAQHALLSKALFADTKEVYSYTGRRVCMVSPVVVRKQKDERSEKKQKIPF